MKEQLCLVRNLLEKRKARRKEQRFVVEGPHLVEEAGELIDFVIYSEELPILAKLREKGIDCYKISRKQFSEISEVETPQGILAVVREQQFGMRDVLGGLIVFCIEVQDPGNLGTIIRTADAVAASGVILSRGTVDLYNSKVIRSTMGSLFHLPIVHVDDVPETIEYLKSKKIKIVATDIEAKKDYWEADLKKPSAILAGNEAAGLGDEIIKMSDETVKVPMPGKAESLNVAMCTSIVLYEALRQRYAR
jgi:TrmH family RNA methyltransferase